MIWEKGVKQETQRFVKAAISSLLTIQAAIEADNKGVATKGAEDLKRESWSIKNNIGFMDSHPKPTAQGDSE